MTKRWARRVERTCCNCITYLPLAFVWGLTSWAVWVDVMVGSMPPSKGSWLGPDPVNFALLCVVGGIIGVVVGAFTIWHLILAARGQTTIECLEKTRYLSPLRKSLQSNLAAASAAAPGYGQQFIDMHANALPGITRPEVGEEVRSFPSDGSRPVQLSYAEMERRQRNRRHEEYMNEQDSGKLPHAFDLGWKRNYNHLFGPSPWLWFIPICNTTGDGWSWEPSSKWELVRDKIRSEREEQRAREVQAGWGGSEYSPGLPSGTLTPGRPGSRPRSRSLRRRGPQSIAMRSLNKKGRVLHDEDLFKTDDEDDEWPEEQEEEEQNGRETKILDATETTPAIARVPSKPTPPNINSTARWQGGGASGILRKTSPTTATAPKSAFASPAQQAVMEDTVD
ncbi:unnamed protein product [Parascedosporium putredinis]|uniref:Palmitoyltransferase pfa3 n=1 Tax=Parascedosporium putredinis TaxID=1442378 RepID=A0A9P1M4T6_9PEZI|nr:unnamed protein product [Parascedosporium putredinis]CAI7987354.1 unnamed protein product [Parascedosporium putredinis]